MNTSSLCTLENLFLNKVKIILKFGRFGFKKLEKGLELTRKIANKRVQKTVDNDRGLGTKAQSRISESANQRICEYCIIKRLSQSLYSLVN